MNGDVIFWACFKRILDVRIKKFKKNTRFPLSPRVSTPGGSLGRIEESGGKNPEGRLLCPLSP
jgi:hypothetical protein